MGFVLVDIPSEILLLALVANFATLVCLGFLVFLAVELVVLVDLELSSLLQGFLAIWYAEESVSSLFEIDVDPCPLSSCFDGSPLVVDCSFLRCVLPFHK